MHVVTNNNCNMYAIVNALDLEELLGMEVANGQPLPEPVQESSGSEIRRARADLTPKPRSLAGAPLHGGRGARAMRDVPKLLVAAAVRASSVAAGRRC